MKIVILNEGASDSRVSASPETVKKINEMNHAVYVQKGAGIKSNFLDQDYEENGAKIFEDENVIREADVIFKINKPSKDQIGLFKENSILIAALDPFNNPDLIEDLTQYKFNLGKVSSLNEQIGLNNFFYKIKNLFSKSA